MQYSVWYESCHRLSAALPKWSCQLQSTWPVSLALITACSFLWQCSRSLASLTDLYCSLDFTLTASRISGAIWRASDPVTDWLAYQVSLWKSRFMSLKSHHNWRFSCLKNQHHVVKDWGFWTIATLASECLDGWEQANKSWGNNFQGGPVEHSAPGSTLLKGEFFMNLLSHP